MRHDLRWEERAGFKSDLGNHASQPQVKREVTGVQSDWGNDASPHPQVRRINRRLVQVQPLLMTSGVKNRQKSSLSIQPTCSYPNDYLGDQACLENCAYLDNFRSRPQKNRIFHENYLMPWSSELIQRCRFEMTFKSSSCHILRSGSIKSRNNLCVILTWCILDLERGVTWAARGFRWWASSSPPSTPPSGWQFLKQINHCADPDPGSSAFLTPRSRNRNSFFPDLGSPIPNLHFW